MKKLFTDFFEGAAEVTKVCVICTEELPLSMFGPASGGNYLRTECKKCTRELGKSRDRAKRSAPIVKADHICPICLRSEEEVKGKGGKKSGAWCCDHDHVSGEFRGWLCHDCNRGIGGFKDDISRLHRAVDYLTK
jgi:hypothetical protein